MKPPLAAAFASGLLALSLGADQAVVAPLSAREPACRLSGRSWPAAGQRVEAGGGRYVFERGTIWEVLGPDEMPAGLFSDGGGTFSWSAEEPAAARVYADNAKALGGFTVGKEGALSAPFGRALLVGAGASRPSVTGEAKNAPAPEDVLRDFRKRFTGDGFGLPEARLRAAGASGAYFLSLMEADRDLLHEVDGALDHDERLAVLLRPAGLPPGYAPGRWCFSVGHRPVDRDRRSAPRSDVRLVDLVADVRELEEPYGALDVAETYLFDRPASALALRFPDRSLSLNGKPFPTRKVTVTAEDGSAVPFVLDGGGLVLFLGGVVPAGSTRTIRFRYEGGFFERRGGYDYWELALGAAWYPAPPWNSANTLRFQSTIRAKKPLLPFASGETIRRAEDGEWNLVETKLDKSVFGVAVVAGKYTIHEETQDGITCRVASYGGAKAGGAAKLTNLFHQIRRVYEVYFGAFPFRSYDILEVNSWGFGQAPPGMMRITKEAFASNVFGDTVGTIFSQGINQRFAHEIAHSWWGHVIWAADPSGQWIEEGMAQVASARLLEVTKKGDEAAALAKQWRALAKDTSRTAPLVLLNEMTDKPVFGIGSETARDRIRLVYGEGPVVLLALRKELGDDTFFTVAKSFLRSFEKRGPVTTRDLVALTNFVTKKDWAPWFEKYVYGSEMP
jgi:hypothetical protein